MTGDRQRLRWSKAWRDHAEISYPVGRSWWLDRGLESHHEWCGRGCWGDSTCIWTFWLASEWLIVIVLENDKMASTFYLHWVRQGVCHLEGKLWSHLELSSRFLSILTATGDCRCVARLIWYRMKWFHRDCHVWFVASFWLVFTISSGTYVQYMAVYVHISLTYCVAVERDRHQGSTERSSMIVWDLLEVLVSSCCLGVQHDHFPGGD